MKQLDGIRAIIFDLDDTLYEEANYYQSGFKAAANLLSVANVGSFESNFDLLKSLHAVERDFVFDRAQQKLAFHETLIPSLIEAFYTAQLSLSFYPGVEKTLLLLRERFRLGIITDGHAEIQKKKISALSAHDYFDHILITDEYGRSFWKPNTAAFKLACDTLQVNASESVFVGDNPTRDIAGANTSGLYSIRIRHPGSYFSTQPNNEFLPKQEITCIEEILDFF